MTKNPIGLVVGGAVKAKGEVSGRTTDEGSAERIADEIAKHLQVQFGILHEASASYETDS